MDDCSRTRRGSGGVLTAVMAAALLVAGGCTDSYYDYGSAWDYDLVDLELPDEPVDYSKYTTFAFNAATPGSGDGGAFTRPYVGIAREEVSESLQYFGYQEVSVEEEPDLVVNFFDRIEERYAYIDGTYYFCWYSWYYWYPCSYYHEIRYNVGTVVIDLADADAEESVWRLVGEGVVTDNQRQIDNRVRAAIDHGFDISPDSLRGGPGGE